MTDPTDDGDDRPPYERAGGMPFFDAVVARFYEGVEADPLLRPMYPDDLAESRRHLSLFLAHYWGGPSTYLSERGHPRLRMRHVPFRIGPAERDAWVRHMTAAITATCAAQGVPDDVEAEMLAYSERAATFMINAE